MIIYRVEHPKSKAGPYSKNQPYANFNSKQYHLADSINNSHSYGSWKVVKSRPVFFIKCRQGLEKNYRHAFKTFAQCRRWFWGWHTKLSKAGFVYAAYEVSERYVVENKYQCAFDSTKAKRITHSPTLRSLQQFNKEK